MYRPFHSLRTPFTTSALTSLLTTCLLLTLPAACGQADDGDENAPSKPSKGDDSSGEDSTNEQTTGNTGDAGSGDDTNGEDTSGDATDEDSTSGPGGDQDAGSEGPGTEEPAPSPDPDELPPVGQDAEDSWTILVYMNGDNDLEHFSLVDFVEMVEVPPSASLNVLVQMDRAVDGPSPGYSSESLGPAGDFTTAKRFRVRGDDTEIIEDLGEVNMGSPDTLAEFVEWGMTESKTGHYGLVFWDHGGGWDLFGPDDSHNHDGLELPEIATGLQTGMKAAQREVKLDFVGFDACLMATLETAQAVRPYASYLLASQELEPGSGWDWHALETLSTDPASTVVDVGKEIIARYAPHVGETRNATLSLVNLDKLSLVTDAIADLAEGMATVNQQTVGQVRARSPEFAAGHHKDLIDLREFTAALAQADDVLENSAQALVDALDEVVVSNYQGPDASYAHGLSLYFPLTPSSYNPDYAKFTGVREWQNYLETYLEAGEELPALAGFTNPDKIGDFTYDSGILYLTGTLAEGTADQLVSATLDFGIAIDGVVVFLGENDGVWDNDYAVGGWDLTALVGTQGAASAPFYYYEQYSSDSDTFTFTTPVLYEGEYLLYYVLVLNSQFELVSESYFGEIEGAIGEVQVPEYGTIQPILLAMDDTGEVTQVPLDTVFDLAYGPISYSFEAVEAGNDVVLALQIADFGGNTDMVINVTTL